VNSDVAATCLDEALEVVLLRGIEHITSGVQEYHGAIPRQILRGECSGVFGGIDRESILLAELANGGDSVGDGAVSEAGGFAEDEDAWLLGGSSGGNAEQKREQDDDSFHCDPWGRQVRTGVEGGRPICRAARAVERGGNSTSGY